MLLCGKNPGIIVKLACGYSLWSVRENGMETRAGSMMLRLQGSKNYLGLI